jgi:two-component system sensor histidine kinase/response regulator
MELLSQRRHDRWCGQQRQEVLDILVQDQAFDGVLMDCQMPVMDGYRQLQRFYINYRDFATEFARALSNSDATAATRAAHNLRSIAGNLGATGVQGAAGRLEKACKISADSDQINALLQDVLKGLQPILAGLKDFAPEEDRLTTGSATGNSERTLELMLTLATQLAHGSAEASDTMADLMALDQPVEVLQALKQIARRIDEFDFEAAESMLTALKAQMLQ